MTSQQLQIVVLYCQHCVTGEVEPVTVTLDHEGVVVKCVMMPCSSKLQVPDLLHILDDGADAVQVVACPEESCRFLVGSRRAAKRLAHGLPALSRFSPTGRSRRRLTR